MIESIIEKSVKNKALVFLSVLIATFLSVWAIKQTPLDALPDLTPPQVIVNVKYMGQSPKIIEDQVVYELTNALLSVAKTKTMRAFTSYENAIVYIIFEDGTDLYWARDRVNEVIQNVSKNAPQNATIKLGPDATGIGWAFEYALVSKTKSLDELRSLQDYLYRYALLGVEGVSSRFTADTNTTKIDGYRRVVSCGYCMNLENSAVTTYTGWDFNSVSDGLGAKSDGIYLLNSVGLVDASFSLGKQAFGAEEVKYMPAVYAGVASATAMELTVGYVDYNGDAQAYEFPTRGYGTELQIRRFDTAKGMRSSWFDLSIRNTEGSDFTIASISFAPATTSRRI